MLETDIVQGRRIGSVEIAEISALIEAHPRWSRWRLSRALAGKWHWFSASGQLKDMAARTLLLKLHQRKLIQLPERRQPPVRRRPSPEPDLLQGLTPPSLISDLDSLLPLDIRLTARRQPDHMRLEVYLALHHYLGCRGPVGENMGYLIRGATGEDLACVLFGAAAWQCAPRDQWIGWTSEQRAQGLPFIANNSRLLILPWVRVKHLASHILSRISARIAADWQQRYGHPIYLLETFVQQDRFRGTCYQAANWIHVGQTTGRTRQDRHNRVNAPFMSVRREPLRRAGR